MRAMDGHKRLEGASALITGAGRGVGKGIALALAKEGCAVAVNYVEDAHLAEETVAEIEAAGAPAFSVYGDVRRRDEVEAMFRAVEERFPRLDVLVNNAGVQAWKGLLELTEEEWDSVIDTNMKGCFLCTQFAAHNMRRHGGGSIVNIGSGCGKVAFPKLVSYTASKGGVDMFTKVAAVELGEFGIRVNCVAPGAIEVERTKLEYPNYGQVWASITPLGRVGTPADVGAAVAFLASRDAAFVTGQTLWVDGGVFTRAPWPYRL